MQLGYLQTVFAVLVLSGHIVESVKQESMFPKVSQRGNPPFICGTAENSAAFDHELALRPSKQPCDPVIDKTKSSKLAADVSTCCIGFHFSCLQRKCGDISRRKLGNVTF